MAFASSDDMSQHVVTNLRCPGFLSYIIVASKQRLCCPLRKNTETFLARESGVGWFATIIVDLKYTGVGGSGSYNQVTNMLPGEFPTCSVNPSCVTAPKAVSGNLAPFNEDMTFVMRGPMQVHNIAVYQPSNSSAATWKKVSSWAANQQPDNMVFMANVGGGASGEWSSESLKGACLIIN